MLPHQILDELTWINRPVSWAADTRTLTIEAGPRSDWFNDPVDGTRNTSAPAATFTPGHYSTLHARVSVRFRERYDAAALVVWLDENHWAKLAFEMSADSAPSIVTVVNRDHSDDANTWPAIEGAAIYLRVARLGEAVWAFHHSTDLSAWTLDRLFHLDAAVRRQPRVGFLAQSPRGTGCVARFDEIEYATGRVVNPRDGT